MKQEDELPKFGGESLLLFMKSIFCVHYAVGNHDWKWTHLASEFKIFYSILYNSIGVFERLN